MNRFLAVKNFEKHQHYRDRDPVWIKFYVAVLSDTVVTRLPDAAQCQLFKFWLLASRHGNRIPYDLKHIKAEIRPSGKFYLTELIDAGLLSVVYENASKKLDESLPPHVRVAEEGEEGRGERLEKANSTPPTPAGLRERTGGEQAVIAAAAPDKRGSLEHWFDALRNGMREKAFTDEDIDTGCLDYLATAKGDLNANHLRGFIRNARDRRLAGDTPAPRNGRATGYLESELARLRA